MRQRAKPKLLAEKLRAVRATYGLTQSAMAQVLELKANRISEFETGRRQPNVILLLWYAQFAGVVVNRLIDDEDDLKSFTEHLEWVRVRSMPGIRLQP